MNRAGVDYVSVCVCMCVRGGEMEKLEGATSATCDPTLAPTKSGV